MSISSKLIKWRHKILSFCNERLSELLQWRWPSVIQNKNYNFYFTNSNMDFISNSVCSVVWLNEINKLYKTEAPSIHCLDYGTSCRDTSFVYKKKTNRVADVYLISCFFESWVYNYKKWNLKVNFNIIFRWIMTFTFDIVQWDTLIVTAYNPNQPAYFGVRCSGYIIRIHCNVAYVTK